MRLCMWLLPLSKEKRIKAQAEDILNSLGLSPSSAITMFYKQVVLQQGLPFDVTLVYRKPANINFCSKHELHTELEKGYQSILSGDVKPVDEVFGLLHKE